MQRSGSLATLRQHNRLQTLQTHLPQALQRALDAQRQRLQRGQTALGLLDPQLVLQRGYAFLTDEHGAALTRATQAQPGQALRATLADGSLDVRVEG